ncbi:uncharacterized protein [Typha angustifolia]|uniref:uncharacterized protein n=1 Tax=Typha angustifolia TaxID=59011 RepID=UPI003C2D973A
MDTLQLSIESFSHSWLPCKKPPSFDSPGDSLRFSVDARDGGSFIEMDPKVLSKRWSSKSNSHEFDFNLPSSDQAAAMVNADQVFRNGLMLPFQLVNPPKREEAAAAATASAISTDSILLRSLSVDSSKSLLSASKRRRQPRHTRRPISLDSSPSHGVVASSSRSSSTDTKSPFFVGCAKSSKKFARKYLRFLLPLYKKVKGFKFTSSKKRSTSCMGSTKPSSSVVGKMDDLGRESAIRDAILHCKNSIRDSKQ